jgi:hypothetical protein
MNVLLLLGHPRSENLGRHGRSRHVWLGQVKYKMTKSQMNANRTNVPPGA